MGRELLRPLALLALLQALSFAVFVPHIGFYSDDWHWLEHAARAPGWLERVRSFAEIYPLGRISQVLYFPLAFELAGFSPWPYQAFLSLVNLGESLLLYLLLRSLLGAPSLALAAAALSMLYPGRVPVHLWANDTPQPVSQLLLLASLVVHESWTRSRRPAALAAGQLLYLLSVLWYESTMFMPLLLTAGLAVRRRRQGAPLARAAVRAAAETAVFALPLAAAMWWQWKGASWAFDTAPNPKSAYLGPSIDHFLLVYKAALKAMSVKAAAICFLAFKRLAEPGLWTWFFGLFTWPWILLYALGVPAAARLAAGLLREEPGRGDRTALAALAAAGFAAAYLPFALSSGYAPPVYGVDSRVNGAGAWAFGLLWAGLVFAATRARPRARAAAFGVLVGVFTWTNWTAAGDWAAAWRLQNKIIAEFADRARSWPPGADVKVRGIPRRLGDVGEGPVFNDHWSFGPALRIATGRSDFKADVLFPDEKDPALRPRAPGP